jgi:acid stress-induced BolA-like protein IbaG/YrbA
MRIQDTIERKLAERFAPVHLEVVNESGNHAVPPGSETHFKVVLVAPAFDGQRLLARHRLVLLFKFPCQRRQFRLRELARCIAQLLLFIGQPKIHRVSFRGL